MTSLSTLSTLVESLPLLEADTAAPGPVESFLERALRRSSDEFGTLARKAIRRLVSSGSPGMATPRLFSDAEVLELTEIFASANATAELLGRALVRDKQREVEAVHENRRLGDLPEGTAKEAGVERSEEIKHFGRLARGHVQADQATTALLGDSRIATSGHVARRVQEANSLDMGQAGAPQLTVPIVGQKHSWDCGVACLAAVLAGYGIKVGYVKLVYELGTTPEKGTTPEAIVRVAKEYGCQVTDLDEVQNEILAEATKHHPVICAVTMYGGGHYVVVESASNRWIDFMDPADDGAYRSMAWPEFQELWHSTDYRGKEYKRYGIAISRPQVKGNKNATGTSGTRTESLQTTDGPAPLDYRGSSDVDRGSFGASHVHDRSASMDNYDAGSGSLLEDLSAPRSSLTPEAALEYFLSLVPTLGIDPQQFGVDMRRHAFSLAWATNQTLLETVQGILRDVLETGQGVSSTPQLIADVFERAGVQVSNPQYAEMVMRTNMMDAYNQGLEDELRDPDVSETFPVWRYDAIVDSRSRPEHAARDGNYYPGSMPFRSVRGTSASAACNCRCVATPVDKFEWRELQAQGARLAT